jgi:N-acetylneuraminate synthase
MGFEIDGRPIGSGHAPYVIAEISANHNGSLERARMLIRAAAQAGADAVKLQTYRPDTITLDCDRPEFQLNQGPWAGQSLYDLYADAHMPWDWHAPLFAEAEGCGITIFSTPFDDTAVELLEALDAPAYKIASFELVDLPLIQRVAGTGKPMIMSTGMATRTEIAEAVEAARVAGCRDLALLHCVSGYPAPIAEANLATIPALAARFGVEAGLSDHTLGITAAITAVALGASIIEKHVTLRRADGGPDAAFSLEPEELRDLIIGVREAHAALGSADHGLQDSERGNAALRRSLYVVADVAHGEILTTDNVRSIRPGHGLRPKYLPDIIGKAATRKLDRGMPVDWSMVGIDRAPLAP